MSPFLLLLCFLAHAGHALAALAPNSHQRTAFAGAHATPNSRPHALRPRRHARAPRPLPLFQIGRPRPGTSLAGLDPQTVEAANDWVSGFAGGTVGVMGTLVALELKKERVKQRTTCPYCTGSGNLVCAQCYGKGSLLVENKQTMARFSVSCTCCQGSGTLPCIACNGDGRAVPLILDRKSSRDPESQLEEVGVL